MKHTLAFAAVLAAASAFAATVTEVRVKALDGFGGDATEALSRCQTKAGAEYDPVTLSHDVSTLKESQSFEEISADAEKVAGGIEVTFVVRRKARYHAPLVVVGCDFFSESKIASESGLQDGYLYGAGDLAAAAAKVRYAYQKKHFHDARVTPTVEIAEGSDAATVIFTVEEGRRQKLHDYVFRGLSGEVEEKVLREAIGDLPWWNPMGWFADDPVTPDQLAQCSEKVAEAYRNAGYLDVKVPPPVREPYGEEKADVVFTVEEGRKYVIGSTAITGLTKYPEGVVREKSKLPETGTVAGMKDLEDAAHRVKVTVGSGDSGLADTRVDVRYVPRADDPTAVDVVFAVKEGVPVVIDDVVVRGNDYTMDKVIRREIALGPGDRMLEDRAERSQKRLENLDYFSRVQYYLESSDRGKDANGAEYRNLVYEVEEKNTGSFMVGIGASSVDSVYVSAEVSQSNFDLFAPGKWFRGAGQKARAYVQWGPRISTIEASVTEPYLFGRHLEFTVEGHRRGRWYDDYDIYRSGGGLEFRYPVKFWPTWNPFGALGLGWTADFVQFDDTTYGPWYKDRREVWLSGSPNSEESMYGDAWENLFEVFWVRDGRDRARMPSSGCYTRIGAGVSVGDNDFWRVRFNHRHYFPVWKRFNHVFMAALRAETIDAFSDDVPIYDRMFLGGPRSIRGIKYRNVSKFVTRDEYGIGWAGSMPWGGQTLFCMNFEYTVPIVKMLRLAVFSDLGSVGEDCFDLDFSDTFAWTVGLGVRLDIPMFPIRLDFGVPLKKPDLADEEVFSFTVGYDF